MTELPARVGPPRVVLDTNVLISAMLSPHRAAAQVLDLVVSGDVTRLVDDRILAEYRDVAARPKFGFDPDDVRRVLLSLEWRSLRIAARPLALTLPDPFDLMFLEVAAAGSAEAVVTGNYRHFVPLDGVHDIRVVSPRDLLDGLAGGR